MDALNRSCSPEAAVGSEQPRCGQCPTFFWLDPNISLVLTTHVILCRRLEVWQTSGTLLTVTCSAIRSWCRPIFVNLMMPTTKFGAERNHQKTEVINHIADLDAAPLERRIDEVKLHATVSTVAAGSTTLGVAVGAPAVHGRPALSQRRRCSSNARTCSAVPGSSDRLLHSFAKALASAV